MVDGHLRLFLTWCVCYEGWLLASVFDTMRLLLKVAISVSVRLDVPVMEDGHLRLCLT